jgi:hypothetical protein
MKAAATMHMIIVVVLKMVTSTPIMIWDLLFNQLHHTKINKFILVVDMEIVTILEILTRSVDNLRKRVIQVSHLPSAMVVNKDGKNFYSPHRLESAKKFS